MAENGNHTCTLCGGETAPGYLIASKDNEHVAEFHGRHRNMYGVSVRKTPVETRMCTVCGFIMSFAQNPAALDIEIGKG
jgi:hypothetical protein